MKLASPLSLMIKGMMLIKPFITLLFLCNDLFPLNWDSCKTSKNYHFWSFIFLIKKHTKLVDNLSSFGVELTANLSRRCARNREKNLLSQTIEHVEAAVSTVRARMSTSFSLCGSPSSRRVSTMRRCNVEDNVFNLTGSTEVGDGQRDVQSACKSSSNLSWRDSHEHVHIERCRQWVERQEDYIGQEPSMWATVNDGLVVDVKRGPTSRIKAACTAATLAGELNAPTDVTLAFDASKFASWLIDPLLWNDWRIA